MALNSNLRIFVYKSPPCAKSMTMESCLFGFAEQLSLLLPAGVTMLPPVALLPPPLPTAQDAALPRGTTVLDAQEELVDALAAL